MIRRIAPLFLITALFGANVLAASAPKYVTMDNSQTNLMDPATAKAIVLEHLPAKLDVLYKAKKWGYLTEVGGGFDVNKHCVVTARVTVLPIVRGGNFMYQPKKTAISFGSLTTSTPEQCSALAKEKLIESVNSVVLALQGAAGR